MTLVLDSGPDPLFPELLAAARKIRPGKRLVAIEVRADELATVLGALAPIEPLLENLGAVPVYRGIEIRTRATGLGRGKFLPVYACRACSGDGYVRSTVACHRCGTTGERRGAP